MLEAYPAKYRDNLGEEETVIQNDGYSLRMTLRGVELTSSALDDWEPSAAATSEQLALFPLHRNELHSCTLDFAIPVPVVEQARTLPGTLHIHIDIGTPDADGWLSHINVRLELAVDGQSYRSRGASGLMEIDLVHLQSLLPEGMYIKSCFNCAFSDYSPAGSQLFGYMACFRNTRQEYLSLRGKEAYFKLMDKMAEHVQETYLCPEFQKRVPGTGYRG